MLSPADADLVRRDSALPGLGTLLDPNELAATMRRVSPRFEGRLHINYVRYKPGQSCLIGYQLTDGTDFSFVSATARRRDAVGKQTKPLTQPIRDSKYGPGRLAFEDRAVLVSFFPNDEKLSTVDRLTETYSWRRLLTKLFADRPDLWNSTWKPIRYKPERRFVGQLLADGATHAAIKLYTEAGFEAARAGAEAFVNGLTFQRPAIMGRSDRRRVLAFEWLPGDVLTQLMMERDFEPSSVRHVGEALAELHAQEALQLPARSRTMELDALDRVAQWLSDVLPQIGSLAHDLADRLIDRLRELPALNRPIHGDFYANQVLLDEDQLSFIDFDEAHLGHPAGDIGSFIAHMESNAIRGHGLARLVQPVGQALLDGYCSHGEMPYEAVTLYTAMSLMKLAPHPFRARENDWPTTTEAILQRAADILNKRTNRHRPRECAEVCA